MKIQTFKPDELSTTLLYVEIMKIFEIYYLISYTLNSTAYIAQLNQQFEATDELLLESLLHFQCRYSF